MARQCVWQGGGTWGCQDKQGRALRASGRKRIQLLHFGMIRPGWRSPEDTLGAQGRAPPAGEETLKAARDADGAGSKG